ncbi:MAG: putative peptidoglycan D,D-transpeptidase PenA [Catillopecten margaritatus gill symbiont]|uniref:Peptidoglycan D,D-transpeptidase PenA n=1 Tax=Catillopecten margaritatus gill symbiont TaxID=3083288 RepID=A0AAU6PF16_9GAMM
MIAKFKALFQFSRTQHYSRRQNIIKWIFIALVCGFGYRVITLHQLNAGNMTLQERGNKQASKTSNSKAWRGDILDRNGEVLASNLILKTVNLDPTILQQAYIPKLAEALMMPETELQAAIDKKLSKTLGRRNLLIKKNIRFTDPILENLRKLKKLKLKTCKPQDIKIKPPWYDKILIAIKLKTDIPRYTTIQICRKRKISGVALQTEQRRYYPKSASLAPLIGRVNYNKKGVSGIEGEFESTLAGQNGVNTLDYNQNSQGGYFNPAVQTKLKHGKDITLTIDANIQYHTYTAIKKSVKKHEADSGSAIILNQNGEILALANYPAEDPNNKIIYNAENYRNHVLSDKIEPGSTMKPFTMLLALDKKKITATDDELINVTKKIGHLKPDNKYTHMTVKKILQKSHNLGTVAISERLTKEQMYNTWNKLGFGRSLGLIPNIETSGLLKTTDSWSTADKRTLSYGYGPMQANLAQLARAYLVFANDGAVPPLKLVKGLTTYEQTTQVFSKESTHKIADLLDAVVSLKGSGYRARIKGYSVAGKTGTAEMVIDGEYNKDGAKRTFFAGFTPVKNPKYITLIRLDHPKKCYTHYKPKIKVSCEGSNSAAMVFKDAMGSILSSDQSVQLLVKE